MRRQAVFSRQDMTQAQTITSKAKSNLAFALIDLPEEERRHMAEFYAFCRTVDDIVDEPGMTPQERHNALNRWIKVINGEQGLELSELEEDIVALIQDLDLDTHTHAPPDRRLPFRHQPAAAPHP